MDRSFSSWSRLPFLLFSPAGPNSRTKPDIAAIAIAYLVFANTVDTMDRAAYPHSISFGNGNANCNNITNTHNNTVNVKNVIADEDPEIMKWVSPLDPRGRHQDVRTDRLDGVGNWLLETNEFREWRSNEGGVAILFCYGDPGEGKTYLR